MENNDIIVMGDFVEFAKKLQGQELRSRARGTKFTVEVTDKGMVFIPSSSGTPRQHQTQFVARVLEQFNSTKSFKTKDYLGILNATYQLALISLYLKQRDEAG